MTKGHARVVEVLGEVVAPLGEYVNEDCTTGLQHADAFLDPGVRPLEVGIRVEAITGSPVAVILAEIKGRVGKYAVYDFILDTPKQVHAVGVIE